MVNGNNQKTKKIAANTLVLFLRMMVLTIVSLYSVRLVLNALGVVDYGVYNAIAALVTSGTCVTSTLAMSTQRYYSFAIGKGNSQQLNQIFSASLLLTILLALFIILVFIIIGPWFIHNHMTIPESSVTSAVYVFYLSLAAFTFALLQIPFLAAIFAHEEMGVYALVSTFDCLLKLLLAYCLYHTSGNRLVFYGTGLVLVAIVTFFCYTLYARRKYSVCRYRRIENMQQIKELLSFSGWTFYSTFAGIATIQGSVLTLNVFFGPIVNTAFTIGNQIYNAMNSLSGSTIVAFRPAMIKSYARNDYEYLDKLFNMGNKMIFYLLLLIVIPFSIDTRNVLAVWLGNESVNEEMVLFVRLYMMYTVILAMNNPITIIIQAMGKIRNYSIAVESLMLAGLPVSICLFKAGFPSYYLMLSLIAFCIIAHVVRIMFLYNTYKSFSFNIYMFGFVIRAIAVTAISGIVTQYVAETLSNTMPLLHLIEVCLISMTLTTASVLAFGMTKSEKKHIVDLLSNRLKR